MADKAGGKPLDEVAVIRAIIDIQSKVMMDHLDTDVAIVGAGPAGLTAAACLAGSGLKVSIFERKLGIGGGMLGGGMCFPRSGGETFCPKGDLIELPRFYIFIFSSWCWPGLWFRRLLCPFSTVMG